MIILTPSFLIGSTLFLQVLRATIKSLKGSKFGLIRPRTYELAALERLEKSPSRLVMGESCDHSSGFIFGWILFILAVTRPTIKA